ncbi:CLUMA_CG005797, isoform A [Clunio marinus]|uniref:CLUMA_CG005797, isoform A n=1 Tax=Clunio marinus TaxID=568069 RepID=A0A1J1HVZ0_9DIPT|nr:CLUMA_CG005797, isoform A [Clunio marinus]
MNLHSPESFVSSTVQANFEVENLLKINKMKFELFLRVAFVRSTMLEMNTPSKNDKLLFISKSEWD